MILDGQGNGPTCITKVLAACHQGTVALLADGGLVTTLFC